MSEMEIANITRTFAMFNGQFFESYQKTNVDFSELASEIRSLAGSMSQSENDDANKIAESLKNSSLLGQNLSQG
jgi:hypothetical protein